MWKIEASEQLHSNTFLSNCLFEFAISPQDRADQGVRCKKGWGRGDVRAKGVCKEVAHFITFSPLLFFRQCEPAFVKVKDRLHFYLLPDLRSSREECRSFLYPFNLFLSSAKGVILCRIEVGGGVGMRLIILCAIEVSGGVGDNLENRSIGTTPLEHVSFEQPIRVCHLAADRADQGVRCKKKGWRGVAFEQKGCAKKLPTSSLLPHFFYSVQCEDFMRPL
ncbi:hypothetical protein CEXT_37061 [Caerostris extrusa]|uniref:Uncharacterized protein n=1 Tax=Caerostris extrusa TaxID=172846 RepID=A0AAV4P8P3_CAEEX|nr:hypothetical protein CEXT_37061 [Caerostris extrusa]